MEARAQIAVAAACLVAALAPSAARAQPASEAVRAEARRLHEEGRRHYELAEYDQAIESFRRAYELEPFPGFLFDAAQAHRLRGRRGDCAIAERLYRNYLRLAPEAPHADEIAKLADEMAACARAEPPTSRRRPIPLQPAPIRRTRPRAALVVAGVGAVVALGGLGLYLWSRSEASDLEESCAPACDPDRIAGPRRAERIGIAALAAGGAASVAGAAWFGARAEERAPPARALWIAPAPGGVAIGGRF
jgi:tetratricopeptide (TPR) repeat protein